jgi:peptide/nickel transport system substrate-binding protein
MPVPFASMPSLKKVSGINLDTSPTMLMTQLNLDLRSGPFAKAAVRRAVSMAIDRETLNQGAYAGFGAASTGVATRALSGATDPAGAFVHDPAAARTQLAEAGYPNGFSFTLSYSAQSPYAAEQSAVAQLVQQQLAEVGVTVKINPVATPAEYSKGSADHAYEATVGTQGPLLPDLQYLIGLRWAGEESLISPGFHNDQLIKLNKEAVAASGAERVKVLNEMLAISNEEIPVIPLVDVPNQWALKAGIRGTFVNGGQTVYPQLMHGK